MYWSNESITSRLKKVLKHIDYNKLQKKAKKKSHTHTVQSERNCLHHIYRFKRKIQYKSIALLFEVTQYCLKEYKLWYNIDQKIWYNIGQITNQLMLTEWDIGNLNWKLVSMPFLVSVSCTVDALFCLRCFKFSHTFFLLRTLSDLKQQDYRLIPTYFSFNGEFACTRPMTSQLSQIKTL